MGDISLSDLNRTELAALQEAATWRNGFRWKPKTMERLAKKGLVVRRASTARLGTAYFLTDHARALLNLPRAA